MRRLHLRLAVCLALLFTGGAHAADLDIKAFYGEFRGGGVAENADSVYFGVTARDFDVVIAPDGNGFKVTWTSVIRSGGTPGNPDVRRKSAALVFEPTARAGIWRARNSADPVTGGQVGWAHIRNNTLSVYLMVVRDDGRYELQQYDRTIMPTGMELVFTRLRNGEEVRTVKGRLVKVAN